MATGFRFGEYVLDVRRHALYRGAAEVHLGERTFGVLRLLVENTGQVVSRQELIDVVWDDAVVSDDSLARAISDLRAALRDDPSHARYIRTIHRRGYLFVAPVTPIDGSEPEVDAGATRGERSRRPVVVLGLAVVIAVVAVTTFVLRDRIDIDAVSYTHLTLPTN